MYSTRRIIKYNIKQLWLIKKEAGLQVADPESAIARLEDTRAAGPPNIEILLQLAGLYRQTASIERSDTAYQEVLNLDQGNSDALNGLGWNRLLEDNPSIAAEYFQQVLDADPENRFALLHLGWAHFFNMDTEKLIDLSDKLLQTLPDETEIYSYLTWVWQWSPMGSRKDPAKPYRDKLLQYCEHALTLDNENFCIDENLLFYYENTKDLKKALIHGQRLVELAPEAAESWYALAHIQMLAQQVDEAIITFEQLHERSPHAMEALDCISFLYTVKQDEQSAANIMQQIETDGLDAAIGSCWSWYDELIGDKNNVIQCLEKIRHLIPSNTYVLQVLGRFYKENKQYQEAEEVFKQLILAAPKHSAGWKWLCQVQAETGKIDKAFDTANESCENGNWHPGVLLEMGDIFEKEGMTWEAIPIFTYLLDICPNDKHRSKAYLLYRIGKMQLAGDNSIDAEQSLIRAVRLDDECTNANSLLGSMYLKQGKLILARKYYKKVTELEPGKTKWWQALAQINDALGYKKDAEECYAKVADLSG